MDGWSGRTEVKHIKPSKQPGRQMESNWYGKLVRGNPEPDSDRWQPDYETETKFYSYNGLLDWICRTELSASENRVLARADDGSPRREQLWPVKMKNRWEKQNATRQYLIKLLNQDTWRITCIFYQFHASITEVHCSICKVESRNQRTHALILVQIYQGHHWKPEHGYSMILVWWPKVSISVL